MRMSDKATLEFINEAMAIWFVNTCRQCGDDREYCEDGHLVVMDVTQEPNQLIGAYAIEGRKDLITFVASIDAYFKARTRGIQPPDPDVLRRLRRSA
jgi:hypothetical protein